MLSSGDTAREDIALLSRFSLQWQRLQAGGELLPDLIELYQWLHTDLAHLVSYKKAYMVTIKSVVDRATKRCSPDVAQRLQHLFARVKSKITALYTSPWHYSVNIMPEKLVISVYKVYVYKFAVGYNRYVDLIGGAIGVGACAAVRRGNKIHTIDDDIPLLHFLSGKR